MANHAQIDLISSSLSKIYGSTHVAGLPLTHIQITDVTHAIFSPYSLTSNFFGLDV